jgi:hypothetical protein
MLLVGVFILRALDEDRHCRDGFRAHVVGRLLGENGESALNTRAISVRCLQTAHRVLPGPTISEDELHPVIGRSY